jgi:hypothetical protein
VLSSIVGALGTRLQSSKKAVCVMCIPIQLSVYGDHMLLRTQNGTNFSMGSNIPYPGSTAPSLQIKETCFWLISTVRSLPRLSDGVHSPVSDKKEN